MQVFFAVSCLLAVLALSNGASEQSRVGSEAQAAVVPTIEVRQVAETAAQTGAAEGQTKEEVASDGVPVELRSTTQELETAAAESKDAIDAREKWHFYRHQLRKSCRFGCLGEGGCGSGCGASASPCLKPSGCGMVVSSCLQPGCGQIVGADVAVVPRLVPVVQPVAVPVHIVKVVRHPVPVPQPVAVPVNIVKVVRHPVPVPQPIAVPVTKFVPVPMPVQPCSDQVVLPCSV